MKIHKIPQRSEEWFKIRLGKMTASQATAIASNGTGLQTYIYKMMVNYFLGYEPEGYQSPQMERGIDLEDEARIAYELEYEKVDEVGFIEQDEYVGCSPDGLIGEVGGYEGKCPNEAKFEKLLETEKPESGHVWQCQMNLLISGREWWDLSYYHPDFDQRLVVIRIYPDEEKFEKLRAGIETGKELIQKLKKEYEQNSGIESNPWGL